MQLRKQIDFPKDFPKSNNIIIDCDAGGDDSHAILITLYLAKKFNKKIVAISCVEGNTTITNVVKNVLICKGLMIQTNPQYKQNFPKIIKGASQNLIGQKIALQGDNYFHEDGVCSTQSKYLKIASQFINIQEQFNSIMNQPKSAAELYNEYSKQYENDLSIMAIGPLTNIALAYLYDNQIIGRINSISIMGGSYSGVGMGQYFTGQFNFHMDPYAAKTVLKVFNNIVNVGIQYVFPYKTEMLQQIFKNKETRKAQFVSEMFEPIMKFMHPLLCDPQTAFPLFCPQESQIKCYQFACQVQTLGLRTKGLVMCRPVKQGGKKIYCVTKMNNQFIQKTCHQSYYY